MRIGKYNFRPTWFLSIMAVALVVVALILANWQFNRADQKRLIEHKRALNSSQDKIRLSKRDTDVDALLYRDAEVVGQYDLMQQFLLENQKYKGVPGYHVFTPFRLKGTDVWILINRGWVKQGQDRKFLPPLKAETGIVSLEGKIENVPGIGMKMGEPGQRDGVWPKRVTYIELPWIEVETKYHYLPYVLYQTKGKDFGLVRDWKQRFEAKERMTPEKHTGYAVQWLSLGLLVIIMFLVLSLKKIKQDQISGVKQGE